jgi:AraC-like DNA-binding protein
MVRPMLLRGESGIRSAAARLGVHERTLARRLAREGTSFQRVLDEVRFAAASELLEMTDLRIGEIAEALSYAAPGPFIDAFRRWSGSTPSAWRKSIQLGRNGI